MTSFHQQHVVRKLKRLYSRLHLVIGEFDDSLTPLGAWTSAGSRITRSVYTTYLRVNVTLTHLSPGQDCRQFADDIFRRIFVNEMFCILIRISLKWSVFVMVQLTILQHCMMTSSNENIFRVTGHLRGEFTGPVEFPAQRPVTRSFDVFSDLRLNKQLSKQPWGWWFETPSWSLWRQCNGFR